MVTPILSFFGNSVMFVPISDYELFCVIGYHKNNGALIVLFSSHKKSWKGLEFDTSFSVWMLILCFSTVSDALCSYINQRNRLKNLKEAEEAFKKEAAEMKLAKQDPFTRRRCRPKLVTKVGELSHNQPYCLYVLSWVYMRWYRHHDEGTTSWEKVKAVSYLHATLLKNRISFISCNVLFHVMIKFSLVALDDIALLDLNVHNTSLIEIIEPLRILKHCW